MGEGLVMAGPAPQKMPWEEYAGVSQDTAPVAATIPTSTPVASPAQPSGPWDEYKAPTVAPIDNSGTREIGGLPDELPDQPKSKMAPEDEAHVINMVRTHADPSQIRQFMAAKGFEFANLDQVQAARDRPGGGVNNQPVYQFPDVKEIDNGAGLNPNLVSKEADRQAGATGRGLLSDLPGVDHLTALGHTIDNKILGRTDKSFGDEYDYQSDIRHGVIQGDEEQHPWLRMAGQLLGSAAIPSGIEGIGLEAGSKALRSGSSLLEARQVASTAIKNRMALSGGAYGAVHGALGADNPADAVSGAITEGGLGAIGGAVLGEVGGALAPGMKAKASAAAIARGDTREVVRAFDRGGVDPLLPYVGGTGAQMASGVTHMTLGGIPLSTAAEKTIDQAKALRDRIASGMGAVKDSMGAGRTAQRGTERWMDATQGKASSLYNDIPIDPDKGAVLSNTRSALADVNAGLSSNPELSKIVQDPRMKAFQDAFTGKTEEVPTGILDSSGNMISHTVQKGGALSWQDLKAFRSYVGEKMNGLAFQSDTSQTALKRLYAGLSGDMEATARSASPDALSKFQRANTYFRARQSRIDQVIKPILGESGDGGPQAAFNQIQAWSSIKGETGRVAQLMRSMPDDDASTVRATLFSRLGNANPGTQNADNNAFSPTTFATHWATMDPRAKAAIFSAEHRKAIDDLVTIAYKMKDSNKYANNSKTALGVNAGGHAAAAWTAISTFNPLAMLGTAGLIGTEFGAGRLLASPGFARWMVGMSKVKNSPSALSQINKLTTIARTQPEIANEVLQLQQRLASAFTSTPTRLAADEAPDSVRNGQRNATDQQTQGNSLQP